MPTNLNSDVYSISEYINNIKREYTEDVDEETLQLGIFGYLGEIFSNSLQNSIVMASEFANESIPTKAKFEKNIIAHALGLGYTSINAVPATFDVLLTIRRKELDNYLDSHAVDTFYLDCDNPLYVEDYEFHLDYDLRIKRIKHPNGNINYTATYITEIMDNIAINGYRPYKNPISDVTNPYLTPPVIINLGGDEIIYVKCTLRQCSRTNIDSEILQDNTIVSRSTNFTFEDQLAGFDIDVTAGGTYTHMIPVYEGLYTSTTDPYFYYTYLDTSTIRIKFTSDSYQPRVNAQVRINLITTLGEEGNFEWEGTEYPYTTISSDKLFQEIDDNDQIVKTLQSSYSDIVVELRPVTGRSEYGTNRKSVEDLKQIIPRESIARGSITNTTDLENYFNAMDTESSRMYIYKRRDNCLERLYYGYILMKNSIGNIVPANTIDLELYPDELSGDSIKKLFKYNTPISYYNGIGHKYIDQSDSGVESPDVKTDYLGDLYNSVIYPLENADDYADYIDMSVVTHHYQDEYDTSSIYHKAFAVLKDDESLYENKTVVNFYKDWILEYIVEYAHKYFAFETDDTATVRLGDDGGYCIPLGANIKSILYTQLREYLASNQMNTETTIAEIVNAELTIPVTIVGTHIDEVTNSEIEYTLRVEFRVVSSTQAIPEGDVENFTYNLRSANNSEVYVYSDVALDKDTEVSSVVVLSGARTIVLNANLTVASGEEIKSSSEEIVDDDGNTVEVFNYVSPYNLVINTKPFYVMYYLPYMDTTKDLNFEYVDETAEYQFISTYISWKRYCLEQSDGSVKTDTYYCDIPMQVNISQNDLISVENGSIDSDKLLVRVFMILKKNDTYHRWLEGTISDYDGETETFNVRFTLSTQNPTDQSDIDIINDDNEIRIYGVNRLLYSDADDYRFGYGDFRLSTDADIYVCYYYKPDDSDLPAEYEYFGSPLIEENKQKYIDAKINYDRLVSYDNPSVTLVNAIDPEILYLPKVVNIDEEEGTTEYRYLAISNKYSVVNGLDFFYDFSDICNSTVTVEKVNDESNASSFKYHISNVPVIKDGYFSTEERAQEFIAEIIARKNYIDSALEVIEDSFGIDFKFVNTYGTCSMVTIDNNNTYLDRVNLKLKFRLKYNANYNTGVIDDIIDSIKLYIEDINSISSIHMSNLCNSVMDEFGESLEFFEFVQMNEYDANTQHMYAVAQTEAIKTPEFVNVETDENDKPCIEIEVVS